MTTPDAPAEDLVVAVIEIPQGSRNKYEVDHETGEIWLDRRLFSATVYPAEYGFIPDTLADDGDPLDILVLLADPTFPGCRVRARPLGMLAMEDEKGIDTKLIAVDPTDPRYRDATDIGDVQPQLLAEIQHFFEVYKMLEPGKYSVAGAYHDRARAWAEIAACRARYAAH